MDKPCTPCALNAIMTNGPTMGRAYIERTLTGVYLTSAQVNQLTQKFPDLADLFRSHQQAPAAS